MVFLTIEYRISTTSSAHVPKGKENEYYSKYKPLLKLTRNFKKKILTAKNTWIWAFRRIFYEIHYAKPPKILRKWTIFHIFEHSSVPPKITKQSQNNWERKYGTIIIPCIFNISHLLTCPKNLGEKTQKIKIT